MLHLLSRKGNMLLHLGVLLLGLCVLVASAPQYEVQAAEIQTLASLELQPEMPFMLAEQMELDGKDMWEIVKPDTSNLAINVENKVTPTAEKLAKKRAAEEAMLIGDVEAFALEAELMVETMSVNEFMEILEPYAPATEPTLAETYGRNLTMEDSVKLSNEEYNALCRIVEAEAGGEDIMGRILVANVVLNRVAADHFPNTVQAVVTQTHYNDLGKIYQFTPAKPGGSYWYATPSQTTKEAVDRALAGEDYSEGAMYFAARRQANSKHMSWFDQKLNWLFQHGNHEFYKER